MHLALRTKQLMSSVDLSKSLIYWAVCLGLVGMTLYAARNLAHRLAQPAVGRGPAAQPAGRLTAMLLALLFLALFGLLLIGAPVAVALALSSLLFVLVEGKVPDIVVMHRMINGVDSFPLLAVPFFILAGNLMNTAGITNRIYDFAKALVGWMRGGLGQVNIGGSVIFAGMSGTAVADAGGLGTIEIKAMRDHGYDIDFAVGITAASSTIGPIIPPSLPMVIYGVMAGASIGQLFAAGFVPGLLMAVALMIMVAWYARRRNYPRDAAFSLTVLGQTFVHAFLALLTPAIIIGGMMFGLFTPDRGRRRRLRLGAVPGGRRLPHARPAAPHARQLRHHRDHGRRAVHRRRRLDLRLDPDHHADHRALRGARCSGITDRALAGAAS